MFNFRYLVAIIILLSSFSSNIQSAELFVILVGDTTNATLGRACQSDLVAMRKEVQRIAEFSNLHLNLVTIRGVAVTSGKVLQELSKLPITSKDVVFLYFSQHGYRVNSMTAPWPNLFFGVSNDGVNFDDINQMILSKGPRLLFSLADVCNNVLPEDQAPPVVLVKDLQADDKKIEKVIKNNYRELFGKTKGAIIISGAIPGTVSYSYTLKGSMCTIALLECIRDEVRLQQGCCWQSILDNLIPKTQQKAEASKVQQTPQFQLLLR